MCIRDRDIHELRPGGERCFQIVYLQAILIHRDSRELGLVGAPGLERAEVSRFLRKDKIARIDEHHSEQVKGLFRRAFIIGRRFRIVHVVHGRGRENEVIEVSTFRAYLDNAAAEQVAGNEKTSRAALAGMQHAVDSTGRVLRDNVWGPQVEDAARRDFTINAMYYDPITQTVVDYHGGLADVRARVLRMIADPAPR